MKDMDGLIDSIDLVKVGGGIGEVYWGEVVLAAVLLRRVDDCILSGEETLNHKGMGTMRTPRIALAPSERGQQFVIGGRIGASRVPDVWTRTELLVLSVCQGCAVIEKKGGKTLRPRRSFT